jgi:hypothetical protein
MYLLPLDAQEVHHQRRRDECDESACVIARECEWVLPSAEAELLDDVRVLVVPEVDDGRV